MGERAYEESIVTNTLIEAIIGSYSRGTLVCSERQHNPQKQYGIKLKSNP